MVSAHCKFFGHLTSYSLQYFNFCVFAMCMFMYIPGLCISMFMYIPGEGDVVIGTNV